MHDLDLIAVCVKREGGRHSRSWGLCHFLESNISFKQREREMPPNFIETFYSPSSFMLNAYNVRAAEDLWFLTGDFNFQMSSMDRGGAPLLNDYKLEFFWKRLPQTILGGPKLRLGNGSRARAPYYVYFNQILIFFVPFILGGLLTVLAELDVVSPSSCGYIYGSLMFLFVLGLQLASWLIRRSANMAAKLQNNALAEDDEVEFVSCCGVETIQFIIPGKKFAVNMVLHALVSGCVCGLMLLYILPSNLNNLFSNTGATVVIFSLGWLAVCIAQYSLTAAPPPEPATFRALDSLEVAPLMRPFYVMAFGLVGVLARYAFQMGPTQSITLFVRLYNILWAHVGGIYGMTCLWQSHPSFYPILPPIHPSTNSKFNFSVHG